MKSSAAAMRRLNQRLAMGAAEYITSSLWRDERFSRIERTQIWFDIRLNIQDAIWEEMRLL